MEQHWYPGLEDNCLCGMPRPDTLASSYHCQATSAADKVASVSEESKACKYAWTGILLCACSY